MVAVLLLPTWSCALLSSPYRYAHSCAWVSLDPDPMMNCIPLHSSAHIAFWSDLSGPIAWKQLIFRMEADILSQRLGLASHNSQIHHAAMFLTLQMHIMHWQGLQLLVVLNADSTVWDAIPRDLGDACTMLSSRSDGFTQAKRWSSSYAVLPADETNLSNWGRPRLTP